MSGIIKAISFTYLLKLLLNYTLVILVISSCSYKNNENQNGDTYIHIQGLTMGTSYSVKALTTSSNLEAKIDSVLKVVNDNFSTYDLNSKISAINRNTKCIADDNKIFESILVLAQNIYELADGYFDPTVLPLVNYWGFGSKKTTSDYTISKPKIDSILEVIGFEKMNWEWRNDSLCIIKENNLISFDFNAIAKGKGVDLVAEMLEELKIKNYMVEIGGEVRASGINNIGKPWTIALDKPSFQKRIVARELLALVELRNESMASSGNYRNFRNVNGEFIGHTINPKTGLPEINELLGVTVVADNCAKADALATAFMAMGYEKAYQSAQEISNIKVLLIKIGKETSTYELKTINGFEKQLVYFENN